MSADMCLMDTGDRPQALSAPIQGNKIAVRVGHRDELNVLSSMSLAGAHKGNRVAVKLQLKMGVIGSRQRKTVAKSPAS